MNGTCDHNLSFLREWTGRLERGELSSVEMRRLSEFMMRERFVERLRGVNSEGVLKSDEEEKWLKYLTLGWFVYEYLGIEGQ